MLRKSVLFYAAKGALCLLLLYSAVFSLSSCLDAQTIGAAEVLSLKKAIEIALQNQPVIQAQAGQVRVSEAKVGEAQASYYPQLNVATGYSRINPVGNKTALSTSLSGTPPGTIIPTGVTPESFEQYTASGSLSQLIFDFGRAMTQVSVQKHNAQAARFTLQNAKQETVFTVKQAYYALLSAQHIRAVAIEAVGQFNEHLQYARALFEIGVKPRFDVTKAEVDLSNAELNLIDAENNVTLARVNLNNAMGQPSTPEYTVEEELAPLSFDQPFEKALDTAYERRSDLKSMRAQKESARQSVRAAQRAYFPTVNGVATYTYVGTAFPLDNGWTAGVNMVFPIFSGFLTKHQVAEAAANLDVTTAHEKKLWQTIRLDLEQAYVALKRSAERIRNTAVTLRQAKENSELAIERYEAGAATPVEVTDALVGYTNAHANNVAASYDYKVALARIEKALGGE